MHWLAFMLNGELPWEGLDGDDFYDKWDRTYRAKNKIEPFVLFDNLPPEFKRILEHAKSLKFDQRPDHDFKWPEIIRSDWTGYIHG